MDSTGISPLGDLSTLGTSWRAAMEAEQEPKGGLCFATGAGKSMTG